MTELNTTPAHQFAEIFPMHEGEPLWKLRDRIKANGLREHIVLLDGKILDGRRRERACLEGGVKPIYREFGSRKSDGDDPLEFVIDINLHRRHLGSGERDLAAARYATAKAGENQHSRSAQNAQTSTNDAAAEKFETTEANVRRAKTVVQHGTPEVQEAVASGEAKVSDAAAVAKEEPAVQKEAVKRKREKKAKTLKEAVEQIKEEEAKDETMEDVIARKNSELESFCRKVMKLVDEMPQDEWLAYNDRDKSAIQKFKDGCATIRTAKCHAVCPKCSGDGCKDCRKSGRVPKWQYDQLVG